MDPLTHSKALHNTKEVNSSMLKGSYSPKILQKIVLPEIGFISIFFKWKWSKSAQNVIFHAILTNFGTIWPTQKPLTLPKSTLNGSYSPKILQKNSTTKNGFISIFFQVKMIKKVPKMSYSMKIWPILGPYEPLKGPLQYQKSTFKG